MASANIINVPQILKDLWIDGVEDYLYEDRPFFAMVNKDTSWSGLRLDIVCQIANGTSVASKFDIGKKNKRASKFLVMQVETADLFALWSIDNKLITLSRDQKGSVIRYLDKATTDAVEKFRRRTAWQLWGNGGGSAGQILTVTGNQLTLVNPHSVRNFDIGDIVEFAHDDGRGGAGVLDEAREIAEIDEDNGVLVFTTNVDDVPGIQPGDFIFQEGDYSADNHVIKGVQAYVCLQTPGTGNEPASIWGMNRTVFPTRLGGHRLTPSANLTVVEAVKEGLTKLFRRSVKTTHIFVSPEIFNECEMSLDSTVRRSEQKIGKVGFEGLAFTSQNGNVVKLFADPDIPLGPNGEELVFFLDMDKWTFHSAEEWGMWLTADGSKKFLTEENANAREGRIGGYGNLYTTRPGGQAVMIMG